MVAISKLISPRQALTIMRATGRVNVWEGSIRSGKTFASCFKWFDFVRKAPQKGTLVMVGRTRDSIARNVIDIMQNPALFGELSSQVIYRSGAPKATIFGRTVYVLGASDNQAEKVLRGLTVSGAYVDEVTVIEQGFFTQLLGRMSVDGAQLFCTTNPDSPYHWFKRDFLDNIGSDTTQLNDWRRWKFTLDDNPSLSVEYKNAIKREFQGLFYKRFILGEWVAAEGAVYDMWDPQTHVVNHDKLPAMLMYYGIGIDYGTTNPTVAILLGLGADDCLYAVDEYRYEPSSKALRKTDGELSHEIRQWIKQTHDNNSQHNVPFVDADNVPVIIDPAAASFRVQMFNDGKNNVAAKNDVLYGIRLMSSLLRAGKLKISDNCGGLIKEFPGYTWDSKATNEGLDQVIKANDHSLDALRYAVATLESRWRRQIVLTT